MVSASNELRRLIISPMAGDILMTRANGSRDLVGCSVLVSETHPNLFLSDKLWRIVLRNADRDCSAWLFQVLNSERVREEVINTASGSSGMRNISKDVFLNIRVNRPEYAEQKAIASVLSAWDRGIRQVSDLIAAKLWFKQGLMQQFLTGKRRFQVFRDEWAEHKLGDLFYERTETNRLDLPLLSITADRGVILRSEVERKDTSSEDKTLYLRIAPGDIGYNTMRMWQGVSAVSRLEGIVSPAYTICTPTQLIDVHYTGYLLKFRPVVNLFHRYSQGLVSDTLNLKFHNFAEIKVRIPSRAEQSRIVQVLRTVDGEIELLRKELYALKKQKKGLMQKLLTGQVRVKLPEGGA